MEQQTQQIDNHVFGEGDFLDGNDYPIGSEQQVKVLSFLGRRNYTGKDGTLKKAAYYQIQTSEGFTKEWRCGISNEKALKRQFGLKSYTDAVGKIFTLRVKKYVLGCGFIIVGVESEQPKRQTGKL